MKFGRSTPILIRPTRATDFAAAIALATFAVLFRAALNEAVPGVAPFVILFPALVVAGVFCGTAPAIVAAAFGGLAIAVVGFGPGLLAWPPFNRAQLDLLLFVPAAATVLWATHALRRSAVRAASTEARLKGMIRQFPGTAAILEGPKGRVLLRSDQSDEVLGHAQRASHSADELVSYGGIHPDGRAYAPDDYPIVRALRTGATIRGERLPYRRDDGTVVQLEVYAGPIHDAAGNIDGAIGMAFDVTERANAETRLIESEARHRAAAERLRAAIDAGALGLWELDMASQCLHLDATMAAMVGLPAAPRQMPREAFRHLIDPADRERAQTEFDRAMAGGPYADEYCVRTPQGQTRWLVSRGTILPDLGIAVGVVSDVTERRQREEALRNALNVRDVLMHEADHRIKNSLQLVISLLRLQLTRVPHPDARDALAQAIARVEAVANAHLSLQSSPDLRSIDIDTMLCELCQRLGSLNPSLTLTCDASIGQMLDIETGIPLGLLASELLTNALRHAYAPGTPGTVALAAGWQDGEIVMKISDAGIGLPQGAQNAGLGTTVVNMLTRQIGATLLRVSAPGEGTCVSVRLKRQACAQAPVALPAIS